MDAMNDGSFPADSLLRITSGRGARGIVQEQGCLEGLVRGNNI